MIVVEDNETIRNVIVRYLELEDLDVRSFESGAGVSAAVAERPPDLVILDVMLPDADGFQIAKRIRERSDTPFLFLTARGDESDRIVGLELGAEDYVVKPFSPKELVLRVRAILRRTRAANRESEGREAEPDRVLRFSLGTSNLEIDEGAHRVRIDDDEAELTAAEWRILKLLSENADTVVSRERILTDALDYMYAASERTVDTHVKNLRAKLGRADWIQTVRGFGYRFRASLA